MIDLGIVKPGSTIRVPFGSFAGSTGAPSATTNLAAADVQIYKDGGTTQRASTAGFTVTADYDALTGVNLIAIDLADNTTAGFYAAGSEYIVVISDVTIDSQTVRFPLARFRIGMDGAVLNTTIATLSSQTSFTLTDGPAEDSALVGCPVYIHDVASAVQGGFAVISAYTGSTKTVTLTAGTTFTAAASDNIMVFPPANARWLGATAQTGRDIGTSVLLSSGTGTGQISLSSGLVTLAGVTHTGAVIPTVSAVTGLTAADVGAIKTKTDFLPSATAGASGGLLISGSNSGTTTLGALTVTGAVTATSGSNDIRINGVAAGGSGGVLISGSNSGTTTLGALTVTGATTLTGAVTGTNAGNDLRLATTVRSGTGTGELSLSSGAIKVQAGIRKNQALANFPFLMTDSTNHNPATGLTVTATRSIDGGAFASGTIANMTEVSNGVYQCDLGAGDLNGDTIALRFTATGADDLIVTLITEP